MKFEESKKVIQGDFDFNKVIKVGFEYYRDYQKEPLSVKELNEISEELIAVLEKHNMVWKVL